MQIKKDENFYRNPDEKWKFEGILKKEKRENQLDEQVVRKR